MRKKVLSLLSLVLVGALFAGCIDFGGKTEEKEKVEYSVKDWEWYTSEDWEFKIKYPTGTEIYGPPDEIFFLFPSREANLIISFSKTSSSFEDAPITWTYLFEPEGELIEYKNISLGGLPARKIKGVFRIPSENRQVRLIIILCVKEGLQYKLTFHLDQKIGSPLNKDWEKLIGEMVDSFRFI
jgi:hypothetical protein